MLLDVPAHSDGGVYSFSAQQLLDYAVIAQEADIKTLWRVEEAYRAEDGLLALCEYVEGSSLMQLMSQKKDGLAQADVVSWGVQLCSTVAALHSLQPAVLRCDVRPTSVILKPDGVLCIGLVQSMHRTGDQKFDDKYLARGYCAPELFVDATLADERSDVYALGSTLFHLATGHSPLEYIRSFKLPPAHDVQPEVCEELEEVITRATKPDAEERYQTVNSMLRALKQLSKKLQEDDKASAQATGRAGE